MRSSDQDKAAFPGAQALDAAIQALPAVRSEEVERARSLAADPHYPPDDLVRRIATLLAIELQDSAQL